MDLPAGQPEEKTTQEVLRSIHVDMDRAQRILNRIYQEKKGSRELSLAHTNLQVALFWLKEDGHAGHWLD